MQNAGAACAIVIANLFRTAPGNGVEVLAGPGNNGGDGWIVAAELARLSVPVRVVEVLPPKTADAIAAKKRSGDAHISGFSGNPSIVVDALLGTGSKGSPNGDIATALTALANAKRSGAEVVALDLPTGLNATSGEVSDAVPASLTLTFGALKRGHLISRGVCGEIQVLDIGLGKWGEPADRECVLADSDWAFERIPALRADAHKGTRKRLAIIAGDAGMAGAAILAGKAALRSGIGLLHLVVARENRDAVHAAVPAALVSTHDELLREPGEILGKADAIVLGPGLHPENARKFLAVLPASGTPLVIDAGGLTAIAVDLNAGRKLFRGREVVLTPHPAEMGRLTTRSTEDVLVNRFEIGLDLARKVGATVLLKGTPTVISSSAGQTMASATGTPALATGGSGDLLSGVIGTLLAHTGKGFDSAVCGAWVHGRAAEICGTSRGITLEDILFAMPAAWRVISASPTPPVLTSLPAVQ